MPHPRILGRDSIFILATILLVATCVRTAHAQQDNAVLERFIADIESLHTRADTWSFESVHISWTEARATTPNEDWDVDKLINQVFAEPHGSGSEKKAEFSAHEVRAARNGIKSFSDTQNLPRTTGTFSRASSDGVVSKNRYGSAATGTSGSNWPASRIDERYRLHHGWKTPAEFLLNDTGLQMVGTPFLWSGALQVETIRDLAKRTGIRFLVSEESLNGLDCYKLEIESREEYWKCWLAKDRDLQPVSVQQGSGWQWEFRVQDFQEHDVGDGETRWFPKRSIMVVDVGNVGGNSIQISDTLYAAADIHNDERFFSDIDNIKPPALLNADFSKALATTVPATPLPAAAFQLPAAKPYRFSEAHLNTGIDRSLWTVLWCGLTIALLCWGLWWHHRGDRIRQAKTRKRRWLSTVGSALTMILGVGLLLWVSIFPSILAAVALALVSLFIAWMDRGSPLGDQSENAAKLATKGWFVLTHLLCLGIFAVLLFSAFLGAPPEIARICWACAGTTFLACVGRWWANRQKAVVTFGVLRLAFLLFCVQASLILFIWAFNLQACFALAIAVWIFYGWSLPGWLYMKNGNVALGNVVGTVGVMVAVVLFVILCFVPTWWRHGVAAALTGLFGFAWVALMMAFLGIKRISLMTLLCLAACSALLMSGYRGAANQILRRKNTLEQLSNLGASVERGHLNRTGGWNITPEGLLVPDFVAQMIGDATTKSITAITLPLEATNPDLLGSWMLDDVATFCVYDPLEAPGVINHQSIARFPKTGALRRFAFSDHQVSDKCISELTKFPNLQKLEMCLDNQALPSEAAKFAKLEVLSLKRVSFRSREVAILNRIAPLKSLSLFSPEVIGKPNLNQSMQLKDLQISNAMLSADWLQWACKSADELTLSNCNLGPGCFAGSGKRFHGPSILNCAACNLTASQLLSLTSAKELKELQIFSTKVPRKAINEFSRQRPDVTIHF